MNEPVFEAALIHHHPPVGQLAPHLTSRRRVVERCLKPHLLSPRLEKKGVDRPPDCVDDHEQESVCTVDVIAQSTDPQPLEPSVIYGQQSALLKRMRRLRSALLPLWLPPLEVVTMSFRKAPPLQLLMTAKL